MNIKDLNELLLKFEISQDKIDLILKDKTISIDNQQNVYLSKNKNYLIQDLIYINLRELLPSKYLLKLIQDNTENKVELRGEKQALNFTYTKNILLEQIKDRSKRFNNEKYYIISFNNEPLGYGQFLKENKKFFFRNLMNIGEYLKE